MLQCKWCENIAAVLEWDWDPRRYVPVCLDHVVGTEEWDFIPQPDDVGLALSILITDDATHFDI